MSRLVIQKHPYHVIPTSIEANVDGYVKLSQRDTNSYFIKIIESNIY